ncbi:MAG: 50S ribosomal protein L13 [Candidatus Azambacteria bacterium GW2011_GWA2_39_10]|uniref:50S ribosomal protein L13 n=1 Tax=Candidatus Azambacteria bacterium GW2011_GWA2_39_10 TaxID=1618611 RepID=A0A0G0LJY9_9BACT|nr:MAG: 50S ribosomal protein L13 [Candidatus Azambacteria bacterium GW2011_GWA2_39_10]
MANKPKTYNIDAVGKSLGRLASEIATLLRGKREVNYFPHLDPMITVKVSGIDKILLSGKKSAQKIYRYHTGYPGGLKTVKYADLIKKDKGRALKLAVLRMLNKSRLRAKLMKRLIIG